MKNDTSFEESFTVLYHFSSRSFAKNGYFLVNFGNIQRFWDNLEIQVGGSKMAAVLEPDVIVTSYDVISLCCGPKRKHFWTYYLPSKFRCHSFNILGVKRWGPHKPPSPGPRRPKKPRSEQGNITEDFGRFSKKVRRCFDYITIKTRAKVTQHRSWLNAGRLLRRRCVGYRKISKGCILAIKNMYIACG